MACIGALNRTNTLRGIDKELIDTVNKRSNVPKTIYACYPCMVDSINMYYKHEWMTERRYIELRNRFGHSCKLIKIRKAK